MADERRAGTNSGCRHAGALAASLIVALCACWPAGADPSVCQRTLIDPAEPVEQAWVRHDFTGHSAFHNTRLDGVPVIEATPAGASALYAKVNADLRDFAIVHWRWRLDQLQPSADLRRSESEDFSGVVFFGFGEPSLLAPDVPTLAYAWTATPGEIGTLIRNPRHPDSLVIVKLEGDDAVGTWREETRDLVADYRAAFGHAPKQRLRYVALISDDDQTGEPARTFYAAITLSDCSPTH
ncbi:MAG: DUF3047 domain-containing protein [Rhodospirillales bacterium]|nr:DUF3047 domain-containing protein [Rhodospirillales bacterium]